MDVKADSAAEDFCRELYPQTKVFFEKIRHTPKYGFKILNGPPLKNAPYLFIGFQPGGGKDDYEEEIKKRTEERWPNSCEYATEKWRLADRMREIFEPEILKRCVGTNAIFLRYPNISEYRSHFKNKRTKRKEIEKFCIQIVCELVRTIEPQKIVAIGLGTLRLFGRTEPQLRGTLNRVLTRTGMIADQPAVGIIHLSGSRISKEDMKELSKHFKQ